MGMTQQLITENLYKQALECLKMLSADNRKAIRLRAIVSAKKHGICKVSQIFGVSENTLRAWIKRFAEEGITGLEYKRGRGRKNHLTEIHIQAIKVWLEKDCNLTIFGLVLKLKKTFDVKTSRSAACADARLMKP